jgi:hypothetical protein
MAAPSKKALWIGAGIVSLAALAIPGAAVLTLAARYYAWERA